MNQTPQDNHINQAKASLQQALSWYSNFRRHGNYLPNSELQTAVRKDLQTLKAALEKLDQKIIRIATFGLVSRGKSAVVNALLGQKVLETGPIHGVTQWPKSIRWTPPNGKVQVEFIDTPGLDEIAGDAKATMAREVVYQADLILFVVAGDITRTEYNALVELCQGQKPLILVFNKIDLYPETDKLEIYQQLQQLAINPNQPILSVNDIVMVAASPQPLPIRVEWQDGSITEEWETPPPQITPLQDKLLQILNQDGRSLLALNALLQGRDAEKNIAKKTLELREKEAEEIIWQYAKYKALAIAINPIAILDVIGGMITDLALIRALAKLYGLPITNHEANQLWRKILISSGSLLLGEIATSLILGLTKSSAFIFSAFDNPTAFTLYTATALTQASLAGYGTYKVGKVAQKYLENGSTWGQFGSSRIIQEILSQIQSNSIISKFKKDLI